VTKVLYIEDNDDNVYMLKMRLELLGDFEVLTAEDGEKGCTMAVSECPDIILMDLEMPVVDGQTPVRTRGSASSMITAVTPPMKRARGFLNTRQETDSGDRRAASPTGREKSM
jgi:CheY-like chemotaxis protein